jgi:hypothetical protein
VGGSENDYRREKWQREIVRILSRKTFVKSGSRGCRNSKSAISAAVCGARSAWDLYHVWIMGKEFPNRFGTKAPRSRQFGKVKMLFALDSGAAGVVLRRNVNAVAGIPRAEL